MAIAKIEPTRAKVRKGPPCEVCQALETIPADEAAGLLRLLSDKTERYTELSDKLENDEDTPLQLSAFQLSRHARGRCLANQKLR